MTDELTQLARAQVGDRDAFAGLYDRHFAFRRHRRAWRRPLLIGIAFEVQRVPRLSESAHDVQLDGVVTEREVYGRLAAR